MPAIAAPTTPPLARPAASSPARQNYAAHVAILRRAATHAFATATQRHVTAAMRAIESALLLRRAIPMRTRRHEQGGRASGSARQPCLATGTASRVFQPQVNIFNRGNMPPRMSKRMNTVLFLHACYMLCRLRAIVAARLFIRYAHAR